jgi:hypothetical protein
MQSNIKALHIIKLPLQLVMRSRRKHYGGQALVITRW